MSDIQTFTSDFIKSRFGSELYAMLLDNEIEEIMLNADGCVYLENALSGMQKSISIDSIRAQTIIRTMASVFGIEINLNNAIVSGHMPFFNARFEGIMPPLVKAPSFCIRKHSPMQLTLAMLMENSMLNKDQYDFLVKALKDRRSIIVCGATSSGKTTLVNALLNELSVICPFDRLVSLEDTPELCPVQDNYVALYTTDSVDMSSLLKQALRMRPDRIIVGEVRGAEALDLIDALSTGHKGGLCTLHAGSIEQALMRLVLLISRHPQSPRLIEPFLLQALDLIVVLNSKPCRHIADIACVTGFDNGRFIFKSIV